MKEHISSESKFFMWLDLCMNSQPSSFQRLANKPSTQESKTLTVELYPPSSKKMVQKLSVMLQTPEHRGRSISEVHCKRCMDPLLTLGILFSTSISQSTLMLTLLWTILPFKQGQCLSCYFNNFLRNPWIILKLYRGVCHMNYLKRVWCWPFCDLCILSN